MAGTSVHPRSADRWTRDVAVGQLTVAVDAAGCFVIHMGDRTVTITNLAELQDALHDARTYRDVAEERWHGRDGR